MGVKGGSGCVSWAWLSCTVSTVGVCGSPILPFRLLLSKVGCAPLLSRLDHPLSTLPTASGFLYLSPPSLTSHSFSISVCSFNYTIFPLPCPLLFGLSTSILFLSLSPPLDYLASFPSRLLDSQTRLSLPRHPTATTLWYLQVLPYETGNHYRHHHVPVPLA